MEATYKINEPDVTFEGFEGEVLLINLANGNYYSLRGAAAVIWPWLVEGHAVSALVAGLTQLTDTPVTQLEADLRGFVDQLLAAELIKATAAVPLPSIQTEAQPKISSYEPPSIEAYSDMQDLLLLDPIHEVDVTGWPKKPDHL